MIELKPRTSGSRAHLFSRTSLCLAEQKGPFLLHNLMTLQARCSTSSLSDEESHDQYPELVFLGYVSFVGAPLHPLSPLSRHGRELARVLPPSEGNTKTSLTSGIRKPDGFVVTGYSELKLAGRKQVLDCDFGEFLI